MRRNLAMTCAALALAQLSGCGGSGGGGTSGEQPIPPGSVSFAQHLDPQNKVLLPYPDGWERLLFDPSTPALVQFIEPQENAEDLFGENIILAKVPSGTPTDDPALSNIQVVSTRVASMAGFDAEETIFDADLEGAEAVDLRFLQAAFDFQGSTVVLVYAGERARFDRNLEIVRSMMRDMQLGQILIDDLFLGSDLSTPGLPGIANNGSEHLLVSCRDLDAFPQSSDLIAQRVSAERENLGDEILVHSTVDTGNTGCRFTRPQVTFDGANYLVVYMTNLDGNRRIVARRISQTGQVIDAQPIDVSRNATGQAFEPATVFDGSRHVVVWHESRFDQATQAETSQIRASFVGTDGSVSGSILVADRIEEAYGFQAFVYRTRIALGNSRVLIAWEPRFEEDTQSPPRPIFGQIMDLSGALLLPESLLIRNDPGVANPRFVDLASDGEDFLAAWIEGELETNTIRAGSFGVFARRISPDGGLLNGDADTTGLQIAAISDLPKEYLDLSFNAGNYLVLWTNAAHGAGMGVYASVVSADLSSVSQARTLGGTSEDAAFNVPQRSHPNVSYLGDQTLVVWPSNDGVVEGWLF